MTQNVTLEQTAVILAMIDEAHPRAGAEDRPERLELWHEFMRRWPHEYQLIVEATVSLLAESEYPPNPGQILARAEILANGTKPTPAQIWEECRDIAREHGNGGKLIRFVHDGEHRTLTEGRIAANKEARAKGLQKYIQGFGYDRLCKLTPRYVAGSMQKQPTHEEVAQGKKEFIAIVRAVDEGRLVFAHQRKLPFTGEVKKLVTNLVSVK